MQFCNPKIRFLVKERAKIPKFDDLNEKISLNKEFTYENIRVVMYPQLTLATF